MKTFNHRREVLLAAHAACTRIEESPERTQIRYGIWAVSKHYAYEFSRLFNMKPLDRDPMLNEVRLLRECTEAFDGMHFKGVRLLDAVAADLEGIKERNRQHAMKKQYFPVKSHAS